jgi:hypothetical protein
LSVSIGKSSALQVKGVKVERVLQACHIDGIASDSDYDQFCAIMEWLPRVEGLTIWKRHFNIYPGGSIPTGAWIRTMTADLFLANGRYNKLNDGNLRNRKAIFGFDEAAVVEDQYREIV